MKLHGTTILAVRHNGKVAVAGDGQVTLNNTVIKHQARKVRRIYNDRIIVGFAGGHADALNLSERLEAKLERYNGNLTRSAVELARDWRTDKYLQTARGDDDRRGRDQHAPDFRQRRRDRTRRGDHGHRFRRDGRPGRGHGPRPPHGPGRQEDCGRGHAHCRPASAFSPTIK